MKKFILLLSYCFFILAFSNCNQSPKIQFVEANALSVSEIYDEKKIQVFIKTGSIHNNEGISENYYSEFKKNAESSPELALNHLKRAITLYPKGKYYEDLFDFLYQSKRYNELLEHFYGLNYDHNLESLINLKKFDKEDYLKLIKANIISTKSDNEYDYYPIYYFASNYGIRFSEVIDFLENDKDLNFKKESLVYYALLNEFGTEKEIREEIKNSDILKLAYDNFKSGDLVLNYNIESVADFEYTIDYSMEYNPNSIFKNLIPKFDGVQYTSLKGVHSYPTFYLIHYSIDSSTRSASKSNRFVSHYLCTYSLSGVIIENKCISYQDDKTLVTCEYENPNFKLFYYKRIWEKPFNINNPNNFLIENTLEKTEWLQINEDGKFSLIEGTSENNKDLGSPETVTN